MSVALSTKRILAALLVLAALFMLTVKSTFSQSPAPAPSEVGRYQLCAAGGTNPYVFLVDTKTGRSWVKDFPRDDWKEVHSPANLPGR